MTTTDDVLVSDADPGAQLAARRSRVGPGPGPWVGPFGHLAAERRRLATLDWHHFEAEQLGATIGAEISGVDLTADLADEVVAELRQALVDYKVLFFRDQPLTPEAHVRFARRFGELEIHPFIPGNPQHPALVHFEKGADVGGYENLWHHDVTWRATPSMGAILHAVSVPPTGGDTLFADMIAAYEGLEPEIAERIDGLHAVHDFIHAFGRNVPPDRLAEMREKYPQVVHPVVRTLPETGRRALYVNRVFTCGIEGMDDTEADELLDLLYREADNPEYQVRFRWRDDSVAFWDNRTVQHYATSDYYPDVRIMERASIVGDRPI